MATVTPKIDECCKVATRKKRATYRSDENYQQFLHIRVESYVAVRETHID
jgi:hypothetical protein